MTSDSIKTIGFIGLGNMGGPMASRLVTAGHSVVGYDKANMTGGAATGISFAASVADVVARSDVVLLSLPDGRAVNAVGAQIAETADRRARIVVDHSTIGPAAAREVHSTLRDLDIGFLDAPVSGGVAGARAGSLAMMIAGDRDVARRLDPILAPMAKNRFLVGDQPGQGQVMKVLNNFLSAVAMIATSEAVSFGERQGLDQSTMTDVLNVSTGRNSATDDKFPNRITPETFDAGFTVDLLTKDVGLYLDAVLKTGTAHGVGDVVIKVLHEMLAAEPGADFTRIFPFIRDRADSS